MEVKIQNVQSSPRSGNGTCGLVNNRNVIRTPQRGNVTRPSTGIKTREIKNKHHIFREEEWGEHAFIIESGTVEIVKKTANGEKIIATIGKGEMFGEMALIDDAPRMASARAVGVVVVKAIPREFVDKKISAIDPFVRGLLRILSDHVRTMATSDSGKAS